MEQGWLPELGKLVVIGHGDSMETALELKETVLSKYPDAEVALRILALLSEHIQVRECWR